VISWKEEKDRRNKQALMRLTKGLPSIFPPAVLARALGRPFIPPTPRLAGRLLRLTIEFRYFECGRNIETPPGRSCLSFGACLTCRSSIVTRTRQNLPLRHGREARRTPWKLN
jgi:hypothetical protein